MGVPMEMNASDCRSKKSLEATVRQMTGNYSLSELWTAKPTSKQNNGKTVIIMDEVDGIGGTQDYGGMQELVKIIKTTKVPIICIANNMQKQKMRSLKFYVRHIPFFRPTSNQMIPRILEICRVEGLEIDSNSIEKMCQTTRADIRQILTTLQAWRETRTKITFDEVQKKMVK